MEPTLENCRDFWMGYIRRYVDFHGKEYWMNPRKKVLTERIDALDNKIGETQGMVKNLRKVLIKLEVVDDRFVF